MKDINSEIHPLLMSILKKYYNFDENEPNLLISKAPLGKNPIIEISNEVSEILKSYIEAVQALYREETYFADDE